MTTDTETRKSGRPTVARVRELELAASRAIEARRQAEANAEAAQRNLDAAIDARDRALDIDVEARALAGCIAAIEEMLNPNSRNRLYADMHFGGTNDALGSSVGRILLHLAARYSVPLEPVPPPEVTMGKRLVSLPADLAEQIERLFVEGGLR